MITGVSALSLLKSSCYMLGGLTATVSLFPSSPVVRFGFLCATGADVLWFFFPFLPRQAPFFGITEAVYLHVSLAFLAFLGLNGVVYSEVSLGGRPISAFSPERILTPSGRGSGSFFYFSYQGRTQCSTFRQSFPFFFQLLPPRVSDTFPVQVLVCTFFSLCVRLPVPGSSTLT